MPMWPESTRSKFRSTYVVTTRKQVVQLREVFRGSAALLNNQKLGVKGDMGKKADLGSMAPKRSAIVDVGTEKRGGVPRAHDEWGTEEVGDPLRRWRRRSVRMGGGGIGTL